MDLKQDAYIFTRLVMFESRVGYSSNGSWLDDRLLLMYLPQYLFGHKTKPNHRHGLQTRTSVKDRIMRWLWTRICSIIIESLPLSRHYESMKSIEIHHWNELDIWYDTIFNVSIIHMLSYKCSYWLSNVSVH